MKYIILIILTWCFLFRFLPFGIWLDSNNLEIWLVIHYGLLFLISIEIITLLIRYFRKRKLEDIILAISWFSFINIITILKLDDKVDFFLKRNIMETHCTQCLENMRKSPLGKVNSNYKSAYTKRGNCLEFDTSFSFSYHTLSTSIPMKYVKWDTRYYYKGDQPPKTLKREFGYSNMIFKMDDNWYLIYYKNELFK